VSTNATAGVLVAVGMQVTSSGWAGDKPRNDVRLPLEVHHTSPKPHATPSSSPAAISHNKWVDLQEVKMIHDCVVYYSEVYMIVCNSLKINCHDKPQ